MVGAEIGMVKVYDAHKPEDLKKAVERVKSIRKCSDEAAHAFLLKTMQPKKDKPVACATGECCTECGSINLLRTGVCHVCADCGTSQGCS